MYQPNSNNNHLYYPIIATTNEFYSPLDHTFPSPFLQSSSSSSSSGLSLQNTSYNHNQHQMDQARNFYEQQQQHELFDFHAGPMTRVYSNGDIHESFGENCGQEGGGSGGGNGNGTGNGGGGGSGSGRVGRYSAEERKERIERYRNKRNQRNFQKKITYACRKTLADSRPRVRGRFARNGEAEVEVEMEVEVQEGISNNRWCGWKETKDMDMNNLRSMMTTTMTEEYCYENEFWSSLLSEGVLL